VKFFGLILFFVLSQNAFSQNRYDVVIDEIMADPSPQIGLPSNEWIELKNTSNAAINLQGWRLNDATGQSGAFPNFILLPDSFVIVCSSSAVAAMSGFGLTISVTGFPSLDNPGDQLSIKNPVGKIIHALAYEVSWYQNDVKKDGGWTLEMIDPKNPCAGISNWKASTAAAGGTPGKKNSADGILNDQTPPQLKRTYTIDSTTIAVVFDEPVDSSVSSSASNFTIDGGIMITSAAAIAPIFNTVLLKLGSKMQSNRVYTLSVSNIKDCKGNLIGGDNKTKAGMPVDANPNDIVINEILFNPKPGGYDFVEFYVRSNKIFDLSKFYIANRNGSGVVSSIYALSSDPCLIFPGDHPAVTEDAHNVDQNYFVKDPDRLFVLSSLPSFPDDEGDVVLLNAQGNIIDEVKYNEGWHFKLIDNADGISLERIDPSGNSQDENNWHSAASTAGYATPTSKNSQYKLADPVNASIGIDPKIFSPDNDGHDDVTMIRYKLSDPGYVANISIFDVRGRMIRHLVKNKTLGSTGYWNWDGLDENGNKLPVGIYIIYTEIFNLQGKKKQFKNSVVLARLLQ